MKYIKKPNFNPLWILFWFLTGLSLILPALLLTLLSFGVIQGTEMFEDLMKWFEERDKS